ncbi:CopG family ribbon-helix-helix protein [Croceicoccus marinus]|jgi:CopG family nickel-responsive transcriptional regulator|uniref:Putative nickel-responsive regulator n=1 Tax=Croceicoccus marinus TaxID=450378 RepID=A0A7G6VXD9_9SPHN|nr:CopG family ribbon-helix-helix protein [Croceicoccus marinus]QNE06404.1 CopG family ribbon-helix-helix protein [Croceicoccus marinus]
MSSEPTNLARLSMSLPAELFRQLDMMVEERGLPSRSQLIAELIRHALAEHEARVRPDDMLAGTVTLVYRGNRGKARQQLSETQADYLKEVISSQHVFLEDDQSMEVLLVQGPANRLEELCDALRGIRGVNQLQLVTTTALLPPLHELEGQGEAPAKGATKGAAKKRESA